MRAARSWFWTRPLETLPRSADLRGARRLSVRAERWPIAGVFRIARGAKAEAQVVVVEIVQGGRRGRGEAIPYARYGETVDGVVSAIEMMRGALEHGLTRQALQDVCPPGAARNAIDCALWDLEAKLSGVGVWRTAGLAGLRPVETLYTVGLDDPQAMARAAIEAGRSLLKLKVGGEGTLERVEAVRRACPEARLVVDANEAWSLADLQGLAPRLAALRVALIEQPLPAGADAALQAYDGPVPLCADESLHTRAELDACVERYAYVNIKLDKAGGLTEALALVAAAKARGLGVMVGCMVATSLSMAPAMLIAQEAAFVDLDGALLLARDRTPALKSMGSTIFPPEPELWG
jgi:L-Ala-D/L-Glu epimerase